MELSAEQRAIRDAAREVAATHIRPIAADADRTGTFPEDNWDVLAERGYTGIAVPAEFGGMECEPMAYALINEAIAHGSLGVATALSVHALATQCIATHADATVCDEWLPAMRDGRPVGAFALSEPAAGSNPAEMSTVARPADDGYRLSGAKQWITNGARAGVYVVFAKVAGAGERSITQFLVPADTRGVSPGAPESKLGLRASDTVAIEFDDAWIPQRYRLTRVGDGLSAAYDALTIGRVGIAAQAVGLAAAALDEAIEYVASRHQFGGPLSDIQTVRHRIATMTTQVEAARQLVYAAARRQSERRQWASMAKVFASETAMRVTNDALQLHGGHGYVSPSDVERFYRDAKVTEIYEGTTQIQHSIIADCVLGPVSE